uniref:Uncharacterized protein n=1 Tax=Kalanchoe fedtschenkoi TaxID=63787 RepID=A0A7N0T8K6_KALFE
MGLEVGLDQFRSDLKPSYQRLSSTTPKLSASVVPTAATSTPSLPHRPTWVLLQLSTSLLPPMPSYLASREDKSSDNGW